MDSLREQKNKSLLFIKEIDEANCYKFAFNELDFNSSAQYQVLIQTMFEYLFKNPFLPSDYKIYFKSTNTYVDPSFRQLMTNNEAEIKDVRENILGLAQEDCDFLVSDIESRNIQSHRSYLESDEQVKIEYTRILFKALKNAYKYKTGKTLTVSFDSFLSSLKISLGNIEEYDNLLLKYESLKKKTELKVPEKTIERVVEKKVYVDSSKPEEKPVEEIKYDSVVKNDKYVIPKDLGKEIKYESSPHIDIAFDFLNRGWFTEAEKEALEANNSLTNFAVFLAQKQYKNVEELILSQSYRTEIENVLSMLKDMPSEAASIALKMFIDVFYNTKLDFERKTFVFKKLIAIKLAPVQQKKIRDVYFDYLLVSKENFTSLRVGYETYFSSFNGKNYEKAIIDSIFLLHSKKMYELVLNIKNQIFDKIDTPQLSELILLCQAKSQTFEDLLKNIATLYNTEYLDKMLNYYFFHEDDKYIKLLSACVSSVLNSCTKFNYEESSQKNGVRLLNSICKYSYEEKDKLINDYVELFKTPKVWVGHKDDAILLLNLLKDKRISYISLINKWFSESLEEEFDFYCQIIKKTQSDGIQDKSFNRINILLSCCLTNDYELSNGQPRLLFEKDLKTYLSFTEDYSFVTRVISAINEVISKEFSSTYVSNFKILLPYCREDDKDKFKLLQNLATELVSFGEFAYAEELYRYMLSLGINSSTCYWGLLFCNAKCKNVEELSNVEGLFENELFQATLHLSKEEDPKIYKQCLDLYDSYKTNKKNKEIRQKEKKIDRIKFIAFVLLLLVTFSFFGLFISRVSGTWWPYFLVSMGNFAMVVVLGVISGSYKEKRILVSSIIGIIVASTSLTVLGCVHVYKAVNADKNYSELTSMMTNFDKNGSVYSIKSKIQEIPTTYKDIKTIKDEADDLERAINKNSYGRPQWGKVYNFDYDHSNWDCKHYLYNYNFYSLFINAVWDIDGTNKQLYYYHDGPGERFSPSSALPNNMESSKDYYFYTEFDYFNDTKAMVNQYMRFGYVNKNDSSDKFLAYEIGDYRINGQGKRQIKVFCYSNNTEYKLIYNSDYK